MGEFFFDDSKDHAYEGDFLTPRRAYRPAVSPGKVTLTSRLPPRASLPADASHPNGARSGQASAHPVQRMPAHPSAPSQGTSDWMDVAFRPDLHPAPDAAAVPLQRKQQGMPNEETSSLPSPSGGTTLPEDVRAQMEEAFGVDFSAVRIHEGPQAAAMGALAYTQGTDIHFQPGQYNPHSQHGRELLGHELTHVVQQSQGRVRATTQAKGLAVNDDVSLEREAHELGMKAARATLEREADEMGARAAHVAAPGSQITKRANTGRTQPNVRHTLAGNSASTAAIQKQEDASGSATADATPGSERVDKPVAGGSGPGFIDNDDGSNIRTRPAELAGSRKLTAMPLPPATRVFVSGRHPQTSEWWYVTAFLSKRIIRGYVQGFRVATDLPEPTAKLYQIKPGDTAEGLAVKEFSSAVRDGHDLRYYENVLLYVNRQRGRAGVKGSYQDPGLFGGGNNNIQLEAGRRIWLVSPAYARALEGVVPDGSLTNGAVAKAKRFAGHIEDLVRSVTESPSHLAEVAGEYAQAIREHVVEIVGIVAGFVVAEALSAFLAATPTGVGQIAAVVIQLGLAAFGATGMVMAALEAVKHAERWLTLAWTARGKEAKIAAASKEFIKMLVSIAMAALAYIGVKGNMGKAATIADSMPTMMPVLAVAGGGQVGGVGTGVATGLPGPAGPFGTALAMSGKVKSSESKTKTRTGSGKRKSVNLPSWKKVNIDMDHIASGHMRGGSRVSSLKDLFPESMGRTQVERAVRQAYRVAKKVRSQGERVLLRGEYDGMTIEMWVNRSTKTIETAYPVAF